MFQIPNWGDDVPKSNIVFGKSAKNKKVKSDNKDSSIHVSTKPNKSLENPKSPDKGNKRKKLKRKKFNKSKSNNQCKPLQSAMKPAENSFAIQTISKDKDKTSRKRKHSTTISTDTKVEKQNSTNKKSKAKKKKYISNTEDPPEQKKSLQNTKNMHNGSAAPLVRPVLTKIDKKKEKIKKMLQIEQNRNSISVSGNNLRQRMLERLKAAQFRFLNEKLYTTSGSEAQKLFQSDPDVFHTYHQGYQLQLKKWPVNPLNLIVKRISKMPKTHIVADMGCGEASLSKRVQQNVRSFDLVASAPGVEACDMAHTPLLSASVDVAVYCLALMGTDLTQYLVEANRVLKMGGHLLIAEVESRFDKVESFTEDVQRLGFKLKNLDKSHQVFFFMEFTKVRDPPAKKSKLPTLTLKPCLYKKR